VCSGQQESGSACVASRGDHGQITFRDWTPVGVEEYGYVATDPMDPNIVFGGKVSRFDRKTGQTQDVGPPRGPDFRTVRTAPVLFSPLEPRTLFFASNTLWKTVDQGRTWTEISPDLTRETWDVPASVGIYRSSRSAQPTRRGVIYTIAPSPIARGTIWAGTDDGLIQVTRDGGSTWRDVTPPALTAWDKVSILEASHFDTDTAYAAVNALRKDDLRPHIYRTRDAGRSWVEVTNGLPSHAPINAVREDPLRRGLLFAASELAVHVSFDDGESWLPLRNNMPATSVRDLVIKDADVVIGTHGRGFWILDDISPLRQITPDVARASSYLFRPAPAWRFRWNKNTDTPLPPDEPTAPNPPDGVTISYLLGAAITGPVTLEIIDVESGETIRRYSSEDEPEPFIEGRNTPDYWLRPDQRLAATPGLHRFTWDLRFAPPPTDRPTYPISAVPGNTPRVPHGLWVRPGTYQVRLTAADQTLRQAVIVRMDPRVQTSMADLERQFTLSRSLDRAMRRLDTERATLTDPAAAAAIGQRMAQMLRLFQTLQQADARPTAAQEAAVAALIGSS
jgi:hypothetical protein